MNINIKYLRALVSLLILMAGFGRAGASYAETDIQSQIDQLEQNTQRQIDALKRDASKASDRVKINGFATLGLARSDSDDYSYLKIAGNDIQNENNTLSDSKVGLQFTFKPTDDMEFVTQLLSEAKTRWDVEATWAYMKYDFTPNWSAKAGKMRLPYYLASEYIDVGHAYPWVRPPSELYSVFINSYTGVEIANRVSMGDGWVNQVKVFYGNTLDGERGDVTGDNAYDFSLKDLVGIENRLSYGPYTIRASYTDGDFNLLVPGFVKLEDYTYRYAVIGFMYDDGGLYVSIEAADSEIKGGTGHFDWDPVTGIEDYSKNSPYSVTLGYNFGKWFPYLTQSKVDDEDHVFGDTRQNSILLGASYFVNSNISLKAGVQRFSGFDGTDGQFSSPYQGFSEKIEDKVNVYSFSINTVF